jgi:hypothetical protein
MIDNADQAKLLLRDAQNNAAEAEGKPHVEAAALLNLAGLEAIAAGLFAIAAAIEEHGDE